MKKIYWCYSFFFPFCANTRAASRRSKRRIACGTDTNCKRKRKEKSEGSTRPRKQLVLRKDVKGDIKRARKLSLQGKVRTLASPSKEQPQDSGVGGGGAGSGFGNNSSGTYGTSWGSIHVFNSPGGSSHGQKGGGGDDSDDGEEGWKKPKPQDKAMQVEDTEEEDMEVDVMEVDVMEGEEMVVDEEKSTDSPQKECTVFSQQGSTGLFCEVANTEQYHGSGMAGLSASPQKVSLCTQNNYDNTSSCVDLMINL